MKKYEAMCGVIKAIDKMSLISLSPLDKRPQICYNKVTTIA